MTYPLPQKLMSGLISSLFASLPSAAAVPGQQYFVSDVGLHGSNWQSDGTAWQLVGGQAVLFQSSIPVGVPPSGTIAANGVLTLGTALDNTYPSCYMYFPAGAWTGSTAGMYYVVMSSTTVGQVYTNQYVSGVATIPSSPTAVSTGAGAYTQTTGSYLSVLSYTMPANLMGTIGRLSADIFCTNNSSAGTKAAQAATPLIASGYGNTAGTAFGGMSFAENTGVTNRQFVQWNSSPNSAPVFGSVTTSSQITVSPALYLSTATDWVILHNYRLGLTR